MNNIGKMGLTVAKVGAVLSTASNVCIECFLIYMFKQVSSQKDNIIPSLKNVIEQSVFINN